MRVTQEELDQFAKETRNDEKRLTFVDLGERLDPTFESKAVQYRVSLTKLSS